MQRCHLGFRARCNHGRYVIAQHKCRTLLHRDWNISPFYRAGKGDQIFQRRTNLFRAHARASIALRVAMTAPEGMTSAYFPFMSHRLTACDVGARS